MTSYLLAVCCLITAWALGWAFGEAQVQAERRRADRAERRLAVWRAEHGPLRLTPAELAAFDQIDQANREPSVSIKVLPDTAGELS